MSKENRIQKLVGRIVYKFGFNMVAGLDPHFLVTNSLTRWYLILQRSSRSSKCFLKVNCEPKGMPRNFT